MEFSTVHISIVLSVVCMGVVFVGGWYLQSSLMEEQYHNMEQARKIKQLNKKVVRQNNQIGDQQSQLSSYLSLYNIY